MIFKSKFDNLYFKWLEETKFSSNVNEIINNNNFKEIILMGNIVIPFIIEKIKLKGDIIVWALNILENKVISETPVSIDEACKLWIEYYEKNN